jgi:hypothetical protein
VKASTDQQGEYLGIECQPQARKHRKLWPGAGVAFSTCESESVVREVIQARTADKSNGRCTHRIHLYPPHQADQEDIVKAGG